MEIKLSTQPETNSQLLARSLALYQATFPKVFYLGLILSIVAFIPRILFVATSTDFSSLHLSNPIRLMYILIDLVSLIFFTAILWRMQCKSHHRRETILTDIKIAFRKLPAIFVATIIQSLAISIVVISLVVLLYFFQLYAQPNLMTLLVFSLIAILQVCVAIYLFFEFYFYIVLIVTEDKGVLPALKRSIFLVWGNWWRTFLLQITPWVIYLVCIILIRNYLHFNLHIYFIKETVIATWPTTIIHILLFALFIPWAAANVLVQLRDLELRKKLLPENEYKKIRHPARI